MIILLTKNLKHIFSLSDKEILKKVYLNYKLYFQLA